MAKVCRANVVLQIEDYEIQHYLQMGYNLLDDYGFVVQSSIPTDISTLQKFYVEHIAKIESLEKTITELTAKLNSTKKAKKKD